MTEELRWALLADAVKRRRQRLGLTQQDVAGAGGPSTATMRMIEGALAESYRASTLYDLDKVLGWDRGTCIRIAEGEVPAIQWMGTVESWVEHLVRDMSWPILTGRDFPVGTGPSGDGDLQSPGGQASENDPQGEPTGSFEARVLAALIRIEERLDKLEEHRPEGDGS